MESWMAGETGGEAKRELPGGAPREDDADPSEAKIQEVLGSAFRAYADDIVKAPVPDKFLELLSQLESRERQQK
jgi:hypothetical protein